MAKIKMYQKQGVLRIRVLKKKFIYKNKNLLFFSVFQSFTIKMYFFFRSNY